MHIALEASVHILTIYRFQEQDDKTSQGFYYYEMANTHATVVNSSTLILIGGLTGSRHYHTSWGNMLEIEDVPNMNARG